MTRRRRQIEIEKTVKRIKIISVLLLVSLVALCITCFAENLSKEYVKDTYNAEPYENRASQTVKPLLKDEPSTLEEKIEQILEDEVPLTEVSNEELEKEEILEDVEDVEETPWYTEEEYMLLAKLIYYEAGGECYEGQVAVGAVVMNRLKDSGFPDTIEGVIYQKNQFSPVKSSKWNNPIPENTTAYQAAIEALNGVDPTGGALFFYNPKLSTSEWIFTRPVVKVIGNHNFAK